MRPPAPIAMTPSFWYNHHHLPHGYEMHCEPFTTFSVVNRWGNRESSFCVGKHTYSQIPPYCTVIEIKRPQPPHTAHVHDTCEIHYIARGRMVFHTEHGIEFLSANDALIALPGARHGNGYCTHARTVVCILMLGTASDGSLIGFEPESARRFADGIRSMPRHFFAGARVGDCFTRVRRIAADDPYAAIQYRTAITDMMLAFLSAGASAGKRRYSPEMRSIMSFIRKNAHTRIDLDHLSSKMHLTPSGFRHRFSRETGMAPKEYLLRERIRIASDILRAGESDITAAAFRSGFASSQYFARIFKRYTGQSPSEYRGAPGTFA